ncbi:hypothetical protein EYF80_040102 [Liparis tanakae]|uniref:Uncharacterized protein n=1 Tax=Liparis tanakae TaxID=230148 RepID=A0A4Z2G7Y1_9TELE|nr:hypothetical protein EYF80_040102 [Liparis tanakae]
MTDANELMLESPEEAFSWRFLSRGGYLRKLSCELPTNMMWNGPVSQRPSETGMLSPIPTGTISDFKMLTTEQLVAAARAGERIMGGRGGKHHFLSSLCRSDLGVTSVHPWTSRRAVNLVRQCAE